MRVSRVLLAVLVLSLLASPAFALLTYNQIDWPGEGLISNKQTANIVIRENRADKLDPIESLVLYAPPDGAIGK